MSIPDEISLVSLFECEPKLLDNDVPYFYNEATYEFSNFANEKFVVRICPAYSDINIQVYVIDSNELLTSLDFKNIDGIEILSDKREEAKIIIKTEGGSVTVSFKPRFKIFLTL